jgi:hypothetical protein
MLFSFHTEGPNTSYMEVSLSADVSSYVWLLSLGKQ